MSEGTGLGLVFAAFIDLLLGKVAKGNKWVRTLNYMGGLLFIGLICLLIFVTIKYS